MKSRRNSSRLYKGTNYKLLVLSNTYLGCTLYFDQCHKFQYQTNQFSYLGLVKVLIKILGLCPHILMPNAKRHQHFSYCYQLLINDEITDFAEEQEMGENCDCQTNISLG